MDMHKCNTISSFGNHSTSGTIFQSSHGKEWPFTIACVTGKVVRILTETLMLLKTLNGIRFNVLNIYLEDSLLISSQYVFHKNSSASKALGHGRSSLTRSANKINFSLQLTFL